jgi:hypothetical protein
MSSVAAVRDLGYLLKWIAHDWDDEVAVRILTKLPRASLETCHRAGLTLVKTTPTSSQLSILDATPAQDGQR